MSYPPYHLQTLKSQRLLLFLATILELIPAIALLFFATVNQLANRANVYSRMFSPDLSRFETFLLNTANEYAVLYLYVLIFPFFCAILLYCLIDLARQNKKYRVIRNESLWALVLGVLLPSAALFLSSTALFSKWYTPVGSVTFYWIYIGIFPLNILLIRNLRQYTKAIRKEKAKEAAEAEQSAV